MSNGCIERKGQLQTLEQQVEEAQHAADLAELETPQTMAILTTEVHWVKHELRSMRERHHNPQATIAFQAKPISHDDVVATQHQEMLKQTLEYNQCLNRQRQDCFIDLMPKLTHQASPPSVKTIIFTWQSISNCRHTFNPPTPLLDGTHA